MLYYLGYYNCEKIEEEKRMAAPPAINKMGYIISVLSEIPNIKTVVVSPSETSLLHYVKGGMHELSDCVSLKVFDSFRSNNKIIRGFGHVWTKVQLFRFLMKNVTSDDTVIVYHSLSLMNVVRKLKKKKKCNLIIEVEELYSDVKEDQVLRKKEIEYLQIADKYIIITELLNKQVNHQNKQKIISHGTYRTNPEYSKKFDDGKIHVVYAGTFNPVKGGALSAVEVAQYLDDKFVLHILGKGNESDTKTVLKKIEQVSTRSKCNIVYEGYKTGKEFNSLIQSCHIGLSTQQPNGRYNASSFPSKILMYMSNGLPVVSIRIPAIETSKVDDLVCYYNDSIPQSIAEAIKSVPIDKVFAVRKRLDDLNEEFISDLSRLLN